MALFDFRNLNCKRLKFRFFVKLFQNILHVPASGLRKTKVGIESARRAVGQISVPNIRNAIRSILLEHLFWSTIRTVSSACAFTLALSFRRVFAECGCVRISGACEHFVMPSEPHLMVIGPYGRPQRHPKKQDFLIIRLFLRNLNS